VTQVKKHLLIHQHSLKASVPSNNSGDSDDELSSEIFPVGYIILFYPVSSGFISSPRSFSLRLLLIREFSTPFYFET
jgi:hypothetical protein